MSDPAVAFYALLRFASHISTRAVSTFKTLELIVLLVLFEGSRHFHTALTSSSIFKQFCVVS